MTEQAYLEAKSLVESGISVRKASKQVEDISYTGLLKKLRKDSITLTHKTFTRVNTFNEDFFEVINTEEKAYWLGYLAADGSLGGTPTKTRKINLTTKASDIDHLLKYKKSLNINTDPRLKIIRLKQTDKIYEAYRYILHSEKMCLDLNKYGIVRRKSLILKPPSISDKMIPHWIRGYFDGDGSIFISQREERFRIGITGTKEVLLFIIKNTFNIELNLIHKKKHHKDIFSFQSGAVDRLVEMYNYCWLDATIYMDRKQELWKLFINRYCRNRYCK